MANKRVFYACEQIALKGEGEANYTVAHGVQSANMTTTFNLEQIFALGQSELYQNLEDLPDIEVTISKCLDGYPLLYLLATKNTTAGPSLFGRANSKCLVALGIFSDTSDSASGPPLSEVEVSGLFVNSISYTFPVQGNGIEEISLIGNDKVWANDSKMLQASPWVGSQTLTYAGQFTSPDSPLTSAGVHRRQNLIFEYDSASPLDVNGTVGDPDATILPTDIYGITTSGTNEYNAAEGGYNASIQDISITAQLGREPVFQQGTRAPYTRTLAPQIEVTCEINVLATSGDMKSATSKGALSSTTSNCLNSTNLSDNTIRFSCCDGTRIYLGTKNKLSSVTMGGADAGGGNMNLTYSYVGYNALTVLHEQESSINAAAGSWWTNRSDYLVALP